MPGQRPEQVRAGSDPHACLAGPAQRVKAAAEHQVEFGQLRGRQAALATLLVQLLVRDERGHEEGPPRRHQRRRRLIEEVPVLD
jgi:hypothetical protein